MIQAFEESIGGGVAEIWDILSVSKDIEIGEVFLSLLIVAIVFRVPVFRVQGEIPGCEKFPSVEPVDEKLYGLGFHMGKVNHILGRLLCVFLEGCSEVR